jgi:hypothetical protein
MTEDAQRFTARALEEFAAAVLAALGLPAADALVTAQAIVRADLEGVETHGLRRLPNYVARLQRGLINPRPQMTFVRRRGGTAVLDADNGPGQVAAARAMVEAIRLAGEYGTGWVAVRQSNHFGAAAYYANLAAEVGMIGVALSNSPPGMAPWGGRQAFLGTNPIGVGMPGGRGHRLEAGDQALDPPQEIRWFGERRHIKRADEVAGARGVFPVIEIGRDLRTEVGAGQHAAERLNRQRQREAFRPANRQQRAL